MAFLYSAFTENTPEMGEWLKSLGYEGLTFFQGGEYLYATSSSHANAKHTWEEPYFATTNSLNEVTSYGYINCLGNSSLFKAVTAVRDDSDMGQWFIEDYNVVSFYENGLEVILCENDIFPHEDYYDTTFHKATLEELIEHFKK